MTTATTDPAVPRAGMLATVRNRRGVVAAVEPFDRETGRLHLVHLEYTDDHAPAEERLLWELEPSRHLLEPNALPDPAHRGGPMSADDFDALLRAARWTALSPYLDPGDGDGRARREPIASPFHGGVRIESYQLVPLLKALRMPRVNLLIADDVGLGKTVEAGLILTELLLRRVGRWPSRSAAASPASRCPCPRADPAQRHRHCGTGCADARRRCLRRRPAGLQKWLRRYRDDLTGRLPRHLQVDGERSRP